jgi:hypothetical protein
MNIEGMFRLSRIFLFSLALLCLLANALTIIDDLSSSQSVRDRQKILKNILDEVVELGARADEDFIKREFWFDVDGDLDNKEEHIVVMRHDDGHNLKMIIQVTYYTSDKKLIVRYAQDTKAVYCFIKGDEIEIDHSDYSDTEMDKLFPGLLKGIQDEKALLRLI